MLEIRTVVAAAALVCALQARPAAAGNWREFRKLVPAAVECVRRHPGLFPKLESNVRPRRVSVWPGTKASRVLAALKRIGWQEKRKRGSHRWLVCAGWEPYPFAFHDGDEIGPAALSWIGKQTGLTPEDQ